MEIDLLLYSKVEIKGRWKMNTNYIIYFISTLKKKMNEYLLLKLKEQGIEDIVPAYADVLTALYLNKGNLKMNEISKLIGKDKSTVTVLVARLIEKEYLIKEKSELDRRVVYIHLSEKAKKLTQSFYDISNDIQSVAYMDFTEDEIVMFKQLISRIYTNFDIKMEE